MCERWDEIWPRLRQALLEQPRCKEHPSCPCVRTLVEQVVNDIIRVASDGIVVRSHRTDREDFIEASRLQTWWEHLQRERCASLVPGGENNPHRWRSRVIGAIW